MKLLIALLFTAISFGQCPEMESPKKQIDYKDLKWDLIHYETIEKGGECFIRKVYECDKDESRTIELVCKLEEDEEHLRT